MYWVWCATNRKGTQPFKPNDTKDCFVYADDGYCDVPSPISKPSGPDGMVTPPPVGRPVATPQVARNADPSPGECSSVGSLESPESEGSGWVSFVPDDVPNLQDGKPPPQAGVVRISSTAIYHRMRRIFHPRGSQQKKVSEELVKQWDRKGKGRTSLEQIFQSCGYNPDWFAVVKLHHYLKILWKITCTKSYPLPVLKVRWNCSFLVR